MSAAAPEAAAEARAETYGFLASLFRRPLEAGQIAALRRPEMLAALAAAGIDPGPGLAGVDAADLREALAIDFTHIFHDPVGKIMPYEGLMLSSDDELGGGRSAAVARFLASVGYRVSPERGEMADHIAVELEFMADLARREAEALAAGDLPTAGRARQIQQDFLETHLGLWTDALARAVSARAQSAFYRSVAAALADFVEADRAALAAGPAAA